MPAESSFIYYDNGREMHLLLQIYVWVKKVYFKQQMGLLGMNKGLQAC